VELEEGIEGLAQVSEVSREKIKTPVGKFQVGEIVSAKIININPKERRIGLSLKQLEVDEEHSLVVDYLSTYEGSQSSLGELLKENLKEKGLNQEQTEQVSEAEASAAEVDPSPSEEEPAVVGEEADMTPSAEEEQHEEPGADQMTAAEDVDASQAEEAGEEEAGTVSSAEAEAPPELRADEMAPADTDDASQQEEVTEEAGAGEVDEGLSADGEEETEPNAEQMTEPETGDEETEKMA
jgi:small subunit ribosomal protein S1